MKTQTDLKIKDKQTEILLNLYRFRFLNRNQIQQLLNHKKHNRIIKWLNELAKEKYVNCEFERKFGAIPSVYCLGTKARKELKKRKEIKEKLLERVYQEKNSSQEFKAHNMAIADIYLSLVDLTKKHDAKLNFYTAVDLTDMKYLVLPHPDAYFSIEQKKFTKRYFLDVFNLNSSEKWLFKRVKQYFKYYEEEYWQDHNQNPFPEIIFVYYDLKTKKELEKIIRKNLEDEENLPFSLVMFDDIKKKGLSKEILYKINNE
jgi:hypothetical protein